MNVPPEQRRASPVGDAGGPSRVARIGLGAFFLLTSHAPRAAERLRPLFVRIAYAASPSVRRATRLNAAALQVDRRRPYALSVLGRFYDVVVDIASCQSMTRDDLLNQIESIDGKEAYRATRRQGGGAIVLTAHAGSFEVGLAALSDLEPKVHVVFKRDAFDRFEKSRRRLREMLGVIESPVDDGPGIWMSLREALREDHVVAVQGDRTPPGQKGMPMPVRGGTLMLPTGPFKLALASGSPVIPILSTRTAAGKVALFIKPEIRVAPGPEGIATAVATYARELEAFLAQHADQWLVLEPAFCENLKPFEPGVKTSVATGGR